MRYIKTFEELNIDTYSSAYRQLRELGFEDRADKLKEKAIDKFFEDLFNKLYITKSDKYPQSKFFVKKINNKTVTYMEQDSLDKTLWCDNDLIWSFFEKDLKLEYGEISKLIKQKMENYFNMKIYHPDKDESSLSI